MGVRIWGNEGGEGKIVGRVNVHGVWGRAGRASRTDPEGIPKKWWTGNNTKEARNIYVAPIMWHKGIESFNKLKTHSLNAKA